MNFKIPGETEIGLAEVVITKADGVQMHTGINVAASAPGIFTEEGNGLGEAVAFDLDKLLGQQLMLTGDHLAAFMFMRRVCAELRSYR